MGTQDFNSGAVVAIAGQPQLEPHPLKYYDRMKIYEPEVVTKFGMVTYFDYDEALAAARKMRKALMLDFTGINCVNCRKMEGQVWSDPAVMRLLKDSFVIVSLYVDANQIDLQEKEQYFSKALGKEVQTLGDKNTDMQVTRFGANSQPYYFFLNDREERLAPEGYGYDPDIGKFATHLHKVLDADR
jgi:thiol:disulfide interchange protein DsbD